MRFDPFTVRYADHNRVSKPTVSSKVRCTWLHVTPVPPLSDYMLPHPRCQPPTTPQSALQRLPTDQPSPSPAERGRLGQRSWPGVGAGTSSPLSPALTKIHSPSRPLALLRLSLPFASFAVQTTSLVRSGHPCLPDLQPSHALRDPVIPWNPCSPFTPASTSGRGTRRLARAPRGR
jgi:hypothetical protein